MGVGGSMFYLSLIRELKDCFSDKNFGIAISVMLCIGYSGGIAANAPFVYAMQYINWREILLILAGVVIAAVIIFALLCTKIKFPKTAKITMRCRFQSPAEKRKKLEKSVLQPAESY